MKNWMTGKNIPGAFRDTLEEYLPADTHATKAIDRWVETDRRVLVLSGGVGTGKSFAAASLVMESAGAKFLTISELTRVSRFDDDVTLLERCPVLVLDDIGEEYADDKGHMTALVGSLLNARHAQGVRTVLTTNLGKEAFRARYGERVWDRFRESGTWVAVGTGSFRGPGGAPLQMRSRHEVLERPRRDRSPEELAKLEPISPERMDEILSMVSSVASRRRLRVVEVDEDARRKDLQEQARDLAERAAEK